MGRKKERDNPHLVADADVMVRCFRDGLQASDVTACLNNCMEWVMKEKGMNV